MVIDKFSISCAVLNNGDRVLVERSVASALGRKGGGACWKKKKEESAPILPEFISANYLKPYISKELEKKLLAPISYIGLDGETYKGVSASVLPDICDVWITALKNGILNESQAETAEQAYILFKGFATVGITALVDEATGYKKQKQDEYRKLFDSFINEEFREWNKEFPEEFPDMIYKLYGIKRKPNKNHPQFFSWFTKKYIYHPLANSNGAILEKLEEKNPVVYEKGGRRYKLH